MDTIIRTKNNTYNNLKKIPRSEYDEVYYLNHVPFNIEDKLCDVFKFKNVLFLIANDYILCPQPILAPPRKIHDIMIVDSKI